jgi:hypothetical protein
MWSLLLPAALAGPWSPAVSTEPGELVVWDTDDAVERRTEDVDGDGKPDQLERWRSVGSGFGWFRTCVRLAVADGIACEEVLTTAYGPAIGDRLFAVSGNADAALAHLRGDALTLDLDDPRQAALDLAKRPQPTFGEVDEAGHHEGRFTPDPRWYPGRPVKQAAVLLTVAQAEAVPNAMAWNASGEPVAPDWLTYWRASKTPTRVAGDDSVEVYRTAHALIVYDIAADRHAWLLTLAPVLGGKVDRHETLGRVTLVGDTLKVHSGVSVFSAGTATWTVPVPRWA